MMLARCRLRQSLMPLTMCWKRKFGEPADGLTAIVVRAAKRTAGWKP